MAAPLTHPDESSHDHSHDHSHGHRHALHAHPPQEAPWSLLRMGVVARLGIAGAASAALWAAVWLAMR
ncbi:hypothetical protein [Bradyrhizobium sp. 2TAF24]|uniref:hypothetical protein n=1 Tax=Bradyrhizobium sp. 2TAF24 TaxID=3233011 RepID=UPI003F8E4624